MNRAVTATAVFDGDTLHSDAALVLEGGRVAGIGPAAGAEDLGPGVIAPAFVDLQVNGGGGVMLNDEPCVATLETIAEAHATLGTLSLLPTLITDTADHTRAAIEATADAIARGIPGIAGLHLEGPHLSVARKGAHDPDLIRPMTEPDLALLEDAAQRLPALLLTVAPETVPPEHIARLVAAGAVVSLGHSDAGFAAVETAASAGASCVTHLFNAMSQLQNREPGLVGAALTLGGLNAGLIADGIHVHPRTMQAALAAKVGPGAVFLVTDAMAPAGTGLDAFTLNGRHIERRDGRLTLADGTLAGADLDLATAVRNVAELGISRSRALAMATRLPARVIGTKTRGRLTPGAPADFVHLDDAGTLTGTWRGGTRLR